MEQAFIGVMQMEIAEKDAIFVICRKVLDEMLNTSEPDGVTTRLRIQALADKVIVGECKRMNDVFETDLEHIYTGNAISLFSHQIQKIVKFLLTFRLSKRNIYI